MFRCSARLCSARSSFSLSPRITEKPPRLDPTVRSQTASHNDKPPPSPPPPPPPPSRQPWNHQIPLVAPLPGALEQLIEQPNQHSFERPRHKHSKNTPPTNQKTLQPPRPSLQRAIPSQNDDNNPFSHPGARTRPPPSPQPLPPIDLPPGRYHSKETFDKFFAELHAKPDNVASRMQIAKEQFSRMTDNFNFPDHTTVCALLEAFGRSDKLATLPLLREMSKLGIATSATYDHAIEVWLTNDTHATCHTLETAMQIYSQMSSLGFVPSERIQHQLLTAHDSFNPNGCKGMFDHLKRQTPLSVATYELLINLFVARKDAITCSKIFASVCAKDMTLSSATSSTLLVTFAQSNDKDSFEKVMKDMRVKSIPHNSSAIASILEYYASGKLGPVSAEDIRSLLTIPEMHQADVYAALLNWCVSSGNLHESDSVLDQMKAQGIVPPNEALANLASAYVRARNTDALGKLVESNVSSESSYPFVWALVTSNTADVDRLNVTLTVWNAVLAKLEPIVQSWCAMIVAFVQANNIEQTLDLFSSLKERKFGIGSSQTTVDSTSSEGEALSAMFQIVISFLKSQNKLVESTQIATEAIELGLRVD